MDKNIINVVSYPSLPALYNASHECDALRAWEGLGTRIDKMEVIIKFKINIIRLSDGKCLVIMTSLELRSLMHNLSWAILHGAVTVQQASLGW